MKNRFIKSNFHIEKLKDGRKALVENKSGSFILEVSPEWSDDQLWMVLQCISYYYKIGIAEGIELNQKETRKALGICSIGDKYIK